MNCDMKSLVKDVKNLEKKLLVVLSFVAVPMIMASEESEAKRADSKWREEMAADEVASDAQMLAFLRGHGGVERDEAWPDIAYAVQNGKEERVAQLLTAGSSPNWQTSVGITLLAMAVKRKDVGVAKLLVEAKADLDGDYGEGASIVAKRGDWNGTTVLMQAAQAGNLELVNLFIGAGASVNRRDMFRGTALNGAVRSHNPAIVQALLAAGAIVRTEDIETAERAAEIAGNREILNQLHSTPFRQRSFILLAKQAMKSPNLLPILAAGSCFAVHFGRIIMRSGAVQDGACDALSCHLNIN
jgi:hypothetical protein